MAWKLIYTSASRLLQAGRSGFGTVARHRDIPPIVVEAAESCSQFSRQAGFDPTRLVFAYRVVRGNAGRFHLLTRIADAGTDYSGRTNHLAEHVILTDAEANGLAQSQITPAGTMLAYSWLGSYDLPAAWLDEQDLWQPTGVQGSTEGINWGEFTGDPRRVRLLAGKDPSSGLLLEYPPAFEAPDYPRILLLFAESQACCTNCGWGVTFTTHLQPSDDPSDFRWIALPEHSPLLSRATGGGRQHITFTTQPPADYRPPPVHPGEVAHMRPASIDQETPVSQSHLRTEPSIRKSQGNAFDGIKNRPPQPKPAPARRRTYFNATTLAVSGLVLLALAVVGMLFYRIGQGPSEEQGPRVTHGLSHNLATPAPQSETSESPRASPKQSYTSKSGTEILGEQPQDAASDAPPNKAVTPAVKERWIRLLPGELNSFRWPATNSTDLVLKLVTDDGGEVELLQATSIDRVWRNSNNQEVLKTGRDNLFPSQFAEDFTSGAVLVVGSETKADTLLRVSIPPDSISDTDRSIVPPNDPLKTNALTVIPDTNGPKIRFGDGISFRDVYASFTAPETSPQSTGVNPAVKFALFATIPNEASLAAAISKAKALHIDDAAPLEDLFFEIKNDGEVDLIPTNDNIRDVQKKLTIIAQEDESNNTLKQLSSLRDALDRIVGELENALEQDPDKRSSVKLPELPTNTDKQSTFDYMVKLLGTYLTKIAEFPDNARNEEAGKFRESENAALDEAKGENWGRVKSHAVNAVNARRKNSEDKHSSALHNSKSWLDKLEQIKVGPDPSKARKRAAAKELIEQITQTFKGDTPTLPAGLRYSLHVKRDQAGDWHLISTNVEVMPAEPPQAPPAQ